MNLLSAVATSLAAALTAWLVARAVRDGHAGWSGVVSAGMAGLLTSVWSNATETEVYAVALLHSVAMLITAWRASESASGRDAERWLLLTGYLFALAPALHLSALVAAPAAIVLAARDRDLAWRPADALLLTGAAVAAAGVGRASLVLALVGIAVSAMPLLLRAPGSSVSPRTPARLATLLVVGASALLILLVRARHDPALNQGNPATLEALKAVVGRSQYAVAPLFPRQTAVWWQAANLFQYVDWQIAMSWGRGIMTSPARVIAAVLWLALAMRGWRAMRADSRRLADALALLLACGTVGVAAYLNLRLGASLGWGIVPDGTPHEARERDYFFVLGFWAWGCLAGYGAAAIARSRGLPAWAGVIGLLVPLAGNWRAVDRSREPQASAASQVAFALLGSAPPRAVLFLDGDNDSYPLWYAQQVMGFRRDVLLVTAPLLPARWYPDELARRARLASASAHPVAGARTLMEQRAAQLADAARGLGRPVAASPALPARERALLGGDWILSGPIYVSRAPRRGPALDRVSGVDSAAAARWVTRTPPLRRLGAPMADHVAWTMLSLLQCPRLGVPSTVDGAVRDSLELRCNFR
jgi:hypothetical protein